MNAQHLLHIPAKHRAMVLCLLLFVCGGLSIAQTPLLKSEYSFRRYTTADGLPSLLSQRIYQDKKGFIWVAGSSGLSRFNGFEFKNFLQGTYANLYHIDEITNINGLRVFSNKYIYTFNREADTLQQTFRFDSLRPTAFSSAALPAGYGIFYVKGKTDEEQYFCSVRDTTIIKLIAHEDLNSLQDHDKAWYDEKRELLYLPMPDGVSILNKNGRVAYYKGSYTKCFVQYRNALWAVMVDGLYKETSVGKFEKMIDHEMDFSAFSTARVDHEGTLFFSDYTTIFRYDGTHIYKIFEVNIITDFIIDLEGNIWLSTYQGVYNLFNLRFRNYSFVSGKPDNLRSVVYDPSGKRIVVGSLNGRLLEITDDKQRELSYPPNPYTDNSTFATFSSQADGSIYLPGPAGFLKMEKGQSQWITFPDAMFVFLYVLPLADGNLLTGGPDLMMKVTPAGNILKSYTRQDLKQRVFSKPCIDKQDRIWIGGADGVSIINGDSIIGLLSDSIVYCNVMNSDRDGNIWFASENRLFKATEKENFRRMELFENEITNIAFTKSGILVVTTLDKIHLFGKNMEPHVAFDHQNGFTGMESIIGNLTEDADGNLWLPTVESLVNFNPDLLMKKSINPQIHLLSFMTSTDNIDWKNGTANNDKFNYKQNNVRFSYIGLSYNSAQNVRYRYRLQGFQNEWSEPVKNREVTFNNLPPGDYVFEIYADSGTDESRSEIQSVAFTITPAFWQTAWFMVICIIFLILVGAGIAIYILQKKNRAIMEKLKVEKELNELRINSIRLKAIPHFNANVLSAIEYHIANSSKEDAMRILGIYSDYTLQTLTELDKAARPLNEELEYVKMYLDLEKVRFLDKFDFHIDVDNNVDKNVQLPNMILHTYCENAIKHGLMPLKTGGLLSIHVSQNDHMVSVSVEDNGVGRTRAALNPLLRSTKQGLSILSRQIEIYNRFNKKKINQHIDDLVTGDEQPAGTRFVVEIPLTFNYII